MLGGMCPSDAALVLRHCPERASVLFSNAMVLPLAASFISRSAARAKALYSVIISEDLSEYATSRLAQALLLVLNSHKERAGSTSSSCWPNQHLVGATRAASTGVDALSTDPEIRFRYEIAMADQKGPSDDSGTSSTRAVSIDEFQTLTQRVASQESDSWKRFWR
ncbi:hypothetical protein Sjap_012869 [Stephania japonica]|uniref:Uncharacterized protein n=1 Tax=Stephania japonica TaxID=461633 RepID=A0AAP0IWQ3_9MAGN